MKTLVIRPKDETKEFLSKIYIAVHDRIVILGHGSEFVLLNFY
jgi:hypothetical protein